MYKYKFNYVWMQDMYKCKENYVYMQDYYVCMKDNYVHIQTIIMYR